MAALSLLYIPGKYLKIPRYIGHFHTESYQPQLQKYAYRSLLTTLIRKHELQK